LDGSIEEKAERFDEMTPSENMMGMMVAQSALLVSVMKFL